MPHAVRSRAPVVFLILFLIALPAFAGEQTHVPRDQGLLASLWQALADLLPGVAQLGPGLDPLGGNGQEPNGAQGDLGPSLDPLG
ncbi:MAG TPA: hypothetical protein VEW48_19585 [Thermoanaerobaculia bacterium]|nr:hypothetical protein [Thermoanaerobaculia bacterium]